MTVRGVLFDVDGTLVDTTYLHAVAWTEALAQQGRTVTTARVHRGIGMGTTELLDELLGEGRPDGFDQAASAAHQVLYRQSFGRLRPLRGAADLLRWCVAHELLTVLASSASEDELDELTRTLQTPEGIGAATSADDAEAGKPHPDIVAAALQIAGLDAAEAVLVGDAVWDGHAARAAGVRFVGLLCGGSGEAELRDAGALEVWRDPGDLLDHIDQSLLGTEARGHHDDGGTS